MVGGPMFSTVVVGSAAGYEQRLALWSAARRKWTFSQEAWSLARFNEVLSFFINRQGQAYGFRFKDWTDFAVAMTYAPNGVGTPVPGSAVQIGTGNGTLTAFQLVNVYSDGTYATTRTIQFPVSGAVYIYVNGTLQTSGYTVDYTTGTGLVTFSTAPASGAVITWAGEFDVPVRFDVDEMKFNSDWQFLGDWTSISVVEIRN